jgi:hypothetical protein
MITPEQREAFVADEPEFAALRPEMRQAIRDAETLQRTEMQEMLDSFPEHWKPLMELPVIIGVPRKFMRSLLPFFTELALATDILEMVAKQKEAAAELARRRVM